jgi:hypothetical protein
VNNNFKQKIFLKSLKTWKKKTLKEGVPDESQQQAVSKAEPQPLDVDQPNTR